MATTEPAAARRTEAVEVRIYTRTASMTGGLFLGLGLGGCFESIVLQSIAQWHQIGSAVLTPATLEGLSQNLRWAGYFHVVTLALMLTGTISLWREGLEGTAPPRLRVLTGLILIGFGVFNLVEGSVAHFALQLHHVRDLPLHAPLYDWIALGASALLVLVGWVMSRTTEADFRP
jgi:uncharacterized membrane protein